jgi:fatty-acyl-CoA synthase
VPKELIFMDKLPLTAVGKPIKHLLQVDAAQRAFREALSGLPGPWDLDVVNTGGSGLRTTLTLRGAAAAGRQQAEAILSTFSVPYVIRVEDPSTAP